MPGSYGVFDDVVADVARLVNPSRMLDIGTGYGKYGRIMQSNVPHCHRIGVEVEFSYVQQFDLNNLYNELRIIDAAELMKTAHNETFDLVVIGDCIEHMPKSVGVDLLNFLTYRCQYLVVLAPEFCIQGIVGGVTSESHVSVWSERDFKWHDAWAWDNCCTIGLYILRGYQPCHIPAVHLIDEINRRQTQVMDFNRERVVRPVNLKSEINRRVEIFNNAETSFRPL